YEHYLYGRSLGIFGPSSAVRIFCYRVTSHWMMSPCILALILLQTALLAYRQWNPYDEAGLQRHGYLWPDYAVLGINALYTVEVAIKIISFGLINDKVIFDTMALPYPQSRVRHFCTYIWGHIWVNVSFFERAQKELRQQGPSSFVRSLGGVFNIFKKYEPVEIEMDNMGKIRFRHDSRSNTNGTESGDGGDGLDDADDSGEITDNSGTLQQQRACDEKLASMNVCRAYLRSKGNRLDFVSVVCFWISVPLTLSQWDSTKGVMLFRSLGALRILRLCNPTHGTNVVVNMFQDALPQLVDVGIFILCFWVILGIIGVQLFLALYLRHCVWQNPENRDETYVNSNQYCGLYLSPQGQLMPFLTRSNESLGVVKGFICPANSVCKSGDNPYNGTVNFDNILQSMQIVFVLMSTNGFGEIMYNMMDLDGLLSSFFFIVCVFILTVWVMNLFIAIIVTSFRSAHEQAKNSPRSRRRGVFLRFTFLSSLLYKRTPEVADRLPLLRMYYRFEIAFVLLVLADVMVQCWREFGMSETRALTLYRMEAAFTGVFFGEIMVRLALHLPHWREFFHEPRNVFDLFLALVTSVIVLGPVKTRLGHTYYWLTVFQLMRFYRVAFAFRWTGDLLDKFMSNIRDIADLALFYFILLVLASIILGRFFEGTVLRDDIDDVIYTMHTLPNAVMSLYVITSTSGWAKIMFKLQQYAQNTFQRTTGSIILIMWFIISNFVVFNIFIAFIEHALSESAGSQRQHQLRKFISDMTKQLQRVRKRPGRLRRIKEHVFPRGDDRPVDETVLHLLLSGGAVNEFVDRDTETAAPAAPSVSDEQERSDYVVMRALRGARAYAAQVFDNPFYRYNFQLADSDTFEPTEFATQVLQQQRQLVLRQDAYLRRHSTFNSVFYVLKPRHPLRRFCQRLVRLSHGERIDGVEPSAAVEEAFFMVMLLASVLIVVAACFLTPLRRRALMKHGMWNWGVYVDLAFLVIFGLEFLVKITADGLLHTPNAYVRSPWNWLDFTALTSIFIEFLAFLIGNGKLIRVTRGLKALRALRLLTFSQTAKNNFHYTMIAGFGKILSAALVAIALLLPFSVWGLNVFNGRLARCNDSSVDRAQCFNEYANKVYDWSIVSPMVYKNPLLSMDNFRDAFLTFYQIISLDGWPDLLQDLMKSTGIGTVQRIWAHPYNALLVLVFNFVSTVFILTLFVSVIISNYSKLTGRAYLTKTQEQWCHVRKYLCSVRASRRRDKAAMHWFPRLCYNVTVERNPVWCSFLNVVLLVHVIDLFLETFPAVVDLKVRYILFVVTTLCFALDSLMRLVGLGWCMFVQNKWNVVALVVSWAGFVTTSLVFSISFDNVMWNFNKLFLLCILMFLFSRSDRINQLLTFASASFPSLFSMMFTWLVVTLVFAMAFNQVFGLTKLGEETNTNVNFRTIPKTLILLFRMSWGEGWNQIMHDFTFEPPFCSYSPGTDNSDCGSKPYAYILFMSWNVISMYIMMNLYISLILDTFSYIAGGSQYAALIERSEVRRFKYAWRRYDPWGSGFIRPADLRDFLRTLRGPLSVPDFAADKNTSVRVLCERFFTRNNPEDPYDVTANHEAIREYFEKGALAEARARRIRQEQFIEEVMLRMELQEEEGVSFQNVLLQIPLYSSFEPEQCLTLADFLELRLLQKLVQERQQKKRALRYLAGYACRWKYL
ncbi:hypothetical protein METBISCDRAFT_10579, partial [Metschnikowia bicuspidata]